ncbi:MAG TPA: N-acetylmuramoyl-L-alanine amidase-like domain-containing protein [Candidatus Bathyarchaeia archaeon]|nr:N-acetylmuramoyl-L-alanine amidase-like domain-containing protein [Candidatus Bathyarchaeia archaeon]
MVILVSMAMFAVPLFEMTPADVDACLAGLNARQCRYAGRVADLARAAIGTPYAPDPLGEGPGAPYDADPLMDLSKVDCVTFVEQTLALAAAKSYRDAFDLLQKIRYRNGEIAFENRNHFMVADWIGSNAFCKNVTDSLGAATEKSTRTIGRRHFYTLKQIETLAATAVDEEMTLDYVPAASAATAEAELPSPALILLIGKTDWLFTLHCGLFIRDEDGGLFYHASSKEEKVAAAPFPSIFNGTSRYIGFTAYEINSPAANCAFSDCGVPIKQK